MLGILQQFPCRTITVAFLTFLDFEENGKSGCLHEVNNHTKQVIIKCHRLYKQKQE